MLGFVATLVVVPGFSHWFGGGQLDAAPYVAGLEHPLSPGPSLHARPKMGALVPRIHSVATDPLLRRGFEPPELFGDETVPFRASGEPLLHAVPQDNPSSYSLEGEELWMEGGGGTKVFLTLDPALQQTAQRILKEFRLPWSALVALEPSTGRILAMAGHSERGSGEEHLALRSGFPAASLFKIITAAAAVEQAGLSGESAIRFRGGNYTLSKYNYLPDSRRDKRTMSFETAMGKSCNPAFARVALNELSPEKLRTYAESFGFNTAIPFDAPLAESSFLQPQDDFETARTAAGFSNSFISPLHAALMMGAVANEGVMMRPLLVDRVVSRDGSSLYEADTHALRRVVLRTTADELMRMMVASVREGTARRQFRGARSLQHVKVAGKTGTLRGSTPKGTYYWFVGAAPVDAPEIAVAALVIDPGGARLNGSGVARRFLEEYFSRPQPK